MKHLTPPKQLFIATLTILIFFFTISFHGLAQDKPAVKVFTRNQHGVGFVTTDSVFSLNFQFRMQNRAMYISKSEKDLAPEAFEFRVRRLRMKFTGFVYNPKLIYYIQLGFSRGDMDWRGPDENKINNSPNIIRDAVIYYNPTPRLHLGFGQTKISGNRQRVISSGDQQFFDRSIVNARFTLDRDFGFFGHYTTPYVIFRGSLTSGEGRNAELSNNGLAYTGRVEFLPFGHFTGDNDYQEGDLEREEKLKVSLAATYSQNDRALRTQGQLGNDLYAARTMDAIEFDLLAKYNGWAWYSEFMNRTTNNPITVNPNNSAQISSCICRPGIHVSDELSL